MLKSRPPAKHSTGTAAQRSIDLGNQNKQGKFSVLTQKLKLVTFPANINRYTSVSHICSVLTSIAFIGLSSGTLSHASLRHHWLVSLCFTSLHHHWSVSLSLASLRHRWSISLCLTSSLHHHWSVCVSHHILPPLVSQSESRITSPPLVNQSVSHIITSPPLVSQSESHISHHFTTVGQSVCVPHHHFATVGQSVCVSHHFATIGQSV